MTKLLQILKLKPLIMKTKHYGFFAFFLILSILSISVKADDLRKIVSLSGYWKFSIGDDSKWANPSYDDSGWDQITVPGKWEDQGYNDYNGYAWYRKTFKVDGIPENTTIYLMMGRIDDADVVYLNGKEVGRNGSFPPTFLTAYDRIRKYVIPAGYLKEGSDNVISVKVYDTYGDGGIVEGPTGIYYDEDNDLLSLNLNGSWKFQTGDNRTWKTPEFNDETWKSINVPATWESQGYEDYDGYAWYRLKFTVPQNLSTEELYLSLGKIDDIDDVYLNGEHIGNVYDLRKKSWMGIQYTGWEWTMPRAYKIREGLLNRNGSNTIAVRVYDGQGLGGIYEGPIGIMTADNYHIFKKKHHSDSYSYSYSYKSFWGFVYDVIFNNDNSNEEDKQ
jgi:Beta-galactosidase/beta-glucuronidase